MQDELESSENFRDSDHSRTPLSQSKTTCVIETGSSFEHEAAIHFAIAKRAYATYEAGGCMEGNHLNDWLQAEREAVQLLAIQIEGSDGFVVIRVTIPNPSPREIVASIAPQSVMLFSVQDSNSEMLPSHENTQRTLLGWTQLPDRVDPEQVVASFELEELVLTLPIAARQPMNDKSSVASA